MFRFAAYAVKQQNGFLYPQIVPSLNHAMQLAAHIGSNQVEQVYTLDKPIDVQDAEVKRFTPYPETPGDNGVVDLIEN